jgi:hypothetical protein
MLAAAMILLLGETAQGQEGRPCDDSRRQVDEVAALEECENALLGKSVDAAKLVRHRLMSSAVHILING